ncbi:FAD-dependent 5-carboxymethylaminomethyl-2-thiouridine(34) oxidoreductase MnmC [Moraxella nasovis]|uniref:FAD-dependent 5-carboxymethylaminomethyl-2-thiouridine(34) oxidoreductase MnmC n=1 Tax=Moraxella nasovis TaxID=2904121 RepID=UPI001F60BBF2|nr:FAD-dependent 5-carboxymethylaminomethyl-2-thiouridine(34) oxidoreductase MnmC [Moraxella nasovis]UNU73128.1 FAD-dependent 5-carboxymethylaminomethyl-2-thiouridine(34) oxidoreductase MnmC [Moraxella nasovis]
MWTSSPLSKPYPKTTMTDTLSVATIQWRTDHLGNTVPVSTAFDDVYFSKAGGLDESRYVFLQGNDLSHRLGKLSEYDEFCVAETGFGTGLNFLALCQLWGQLKQQGKLANHARLHFISTEKFPLTKENLTLALNAWQDNDGLSFYINSLLCQYPPLLAGCHRLTIDDDITLDLWFGDAKASFDTLLKTKPKGAGVHAWFLDGFSPSKNSELWSPALFDTIAKLSADGASLATFTAAGFVRRALVDVGFLVTKVKGFGHKREMLTAHITKPHQALNKLDKPKHVAIIGAGISGLCLTHSLALRGIQVSLIDKQSPLAGASGNPRALLAPKLTLIEKAKDHLPTVGFLYAERFYRQFNNTDQTVFNNTGVIDFLMPTKKSTEKLRSLISPYPDELIYEIKDKTFLEHQINAAIPKAGLVSPRAFMNAVLTDPLIKFIKADIKQIRHGSDVHLITDAGEILADAAVICSGFESHLLCDELFNCRKIRGQVSWLKLSHDDNHAQLLPRTPIKYDGYCAAFDLEDESHLLMGASFVRNCTDTTVTDDEHTFNLDKLAQALPSLADKLDITPSTLSGRASIRAQTPDYHPIVGQVADDLYAMYGMGSKGFSFAPLCAQILASYICGSFIPVSETLLDSLSPKRPRLQTPLNENF